jgi:von Willebrand factor type A domain
MSNPSTNPSNASVPEPSSSGPAARERRGPMVRVGDKIVAHKPGTSVNVGPSLADICIVFDTTGSMSGKITQLIECMTGFADELGSLSLDWRISVVPFGGLTEPGDRVELQWPFVTTAQQAKTQLRQMPRFSGEENIRESSIEAMLGAADKPWRQGAVRVVVLLTDEPAVGENRAYEVLAKFQKQEIITFVASPARPYFLMWAKETAGQWYRVGPSMNTGELLTLLHGLTHRVAITAAEVHAMAGGDYQKYLAITSGEEPFIESGGLRVLTRLTTS